MANRINYTDKVALNARTEIADINKHTAADDNEIKNVVNAHATNIETLEANQTSGVIRADTIVDEGDGRSFLPVSGDTSTAYIVDGEVSPNEAKNGNYEWDGAAYTKTAYQTVAGSKTDLATNGSQDVFTSQGAFNLDANLQGQIDSNDTEIAQNISDIAQNTLDITQNQSDIADNQTRSTDTENILLVGSDAYTHAERGVSDGFTTERLVQLDNEIEANLDADFYFKAGHSKGAGKIGIAVPDVSAADLSISRNSIATFTNKRGLVETASANVPRFDWSSGEPALLTEPQAEQLLKNSGWKGGGSTPTDWSAATSGQTTPVNSVFGDLVTAYRFEATNERPYLSTSFPVSSGVFYSAHINIEQLNQNSQIKSVILLSGLSNTVFYKNGVLINDTELVEAGNTYSVVGEATSAGNVNLRVGLGVTSNTNGDIVISQPQVIEGDSPDRGSFMLSPIGATVVRLADTGIETGDISQYIDSTQGSFEVNWRRAIKQNNSFTYLTISGDTLDDRVEIYFNNTNDVSARIKVAGVQYVLVAGTNDNTFKTTRVEWGNGEMRSYLDNVLISTLAINNFNAGDLKKILLNNAADRDCQIKSIKIS